jgi:hypothetical protein
MEKKTSGTIVVNRRLRKISPKGLRAAAFCLKTIPRKAPAKREKIKIMEKPYDVKNGGNLIFIFSSQSGNCTSWPWGQTIILDFDYISRKSAYDPRLFPENEEISSLPPCRFPIGIYLF